MKIEHLINKMTAIVEVVQKMDTHLKTLKHSHGVIVAVNKEMAKEGSTYDPETAEHQRSYYAGLECDSHEKMMLQFEEVLKKAVSINEEIGRVLLK